MSDLLIHAFQTHPMYRDISLTDCRTLMNCLGCREKTYQKDQIIAATENSSRQIGIVISGCIHIIKEDIWGRRTFLTYTGDDGIFGEVLMGENLSERGILFKAAEPTTILKPERTGNPLQSSGAHHDPDNSCGQNSPSLQELVSLSPQALQKSL